MVDLFGIFPHTQKKYPTSGERLIREYTKFNFAVDEGKERLNPSREKNEGNHGRRKVEKSCVTFLLCDPDWYVHKPDVHNKWDDSTHTLPDIFVPYYCAAEDSTHDRMTYLARGSVRGWCRIALMGVQTHNELDGRRHERP